MFLSKSPRECPAFSGVCLAMLIGMTAFAGEKIQFSNRDGAPVKPASNTQAKQQFRAPDFLGVTRYRKDPLEGVVAVQTEGQFPSDREKSKKGRQKDKWSMYGEKNDLAKDDPSDRDDNTDEDKDRSSSRGRRKDTGSNKEDRRTEDQKNYEDLTMNSTNQFRLDSRRDATGNLLNSRNGGGNLVDGRDANSSSFSGNAANGKFSPDNQPVGLAGAGDRLTPGNMRIELGGRRMDSQSGMLGPGLPSFLRRDDGVLASDRNTGLGEQRGLDSGAGAGSAFGGGPSKLNDFGVVSSLGGGKQPAADTPRSEAPRFEPKPAVLEIPKRKL